MTLSGSNDTHYYIWVDQFDTLGLGKNTPIVTGNSSDSLVALVNGKFVIMRVPYPMGFFAKGMDGRIDDAKTGWKGRGVFTTWGTRAPFHSETGKGTMPKVVHFQIRTRSAGALTRIRYAANLVLGLRLTFCGKATSAEERNPPWVAAIPTLQTRKYPRGRRRRAL